jgi:hypothetical protein
MSLRARAVWFVAALLLAPVSGALAFFLAGAVLFPIAEPHYASRIVVSLGLMALVYGGESVLNGGLIETCGLLSGNCSQHDLRPQAFGLWALLAAGGAAALAWLWWRYQRSHPPSASPSSPSRP